MEERVPGVVGGGVFISGPEVPSSAPHPHEDSIQGLFIASGR